MARRMGPFASPGRFASRGLFYSRELRPGVHVVAKWPSRPTGQPSELQLKYRELMAGVQRSARYRIGPEQIAARLVSAGSPYLPKDCLIASAWGTMIAVSVKGGGTVTGVRVLASEIQSMLDTITTVRGSTLFRTANGWRPLYPLQAGYVLTDNGPGLEPSWQPAKGSGGSNGVWYIWAAGGIAGETSAASGCVMTPFDSIEITSIASYIQDHGTRSLRPGVAAIEDGVITGIVAHGDYQIINPGYTGLTAFALPPSTSLVAGQQYFVYLEADQSGGPVNSYNSYSNAPSGVGPLSSGPNYADTSEPPAVGVSVPISIAGAHIQGWRMS